MKGQKLFGGVSYLIGNRGNSILFFPQTAKELKKVFLPVEQSAKQSEASEASEATSRRTSEASEGRPVSEVSETEKKRKARMAAILSIMSDDSTTTDEKSCNEVYKSKGYEKYTKKELDKGSSSAIYELCLGNECKLAIRYSYLLFQDILFQTYGGAQRIFENEVSIYKYLNGIRGPNVPKMYDNWICQMTPEEYKQTIGRGRIDKKEKFGVIIMDKLGKSVAKVFAEKKMLDKSLLKGVFNQLSLLHQKAKVAHYDPSLLNFLIKDKDVYVIDFQFSHRFDNNSVVNYDHIIWDYAFVEMSIITFYMVYQYPNNEGNPFSIKLKDELIDDYNYRNFHHFTDKQIGDNVLSVLYEQDVIKKAYNEFVFLGLNRIDLFGKIFRSLGIDLDEAEYKIRRQLGPNKVVDQMNVIPYNNVFALFDQILNIKRYYDIIKSPLVDFIQLYKDIGGKEEVKNKSGFWYLYYFGAGFYLNYFEEDEMRCLLVRYAENFKGASELVSGVVEGKEKSVRLNEKTKEIIPIHKNYSFQDLAQVKIGRFPSSSKVEFTIRHRFEDLLIPLCYFKLFFGTKLISSDIPVLGKSVWRSIMELIHKLHSNGIIHGNINIYSIVFSAKEKKFKLTMFGTKGDVISDWIDYMRVYIQLSFKTMMSIDYKNISNYLDKKQLSEVKKSISRMLTERKGIMEKSVNNVEIWKFTT